MYFHVNLNFSKFNKKCIFLVSEQYIESIMHGATIKVKSALLGCNNEMNLLQLKFVSKDVKYLTCL